MYICRRGAHAELTSNISMCVNLLFNSTSCSWLWLHAYIALCTITQTDTHAQVVLEARCASCVSECCAAPGPRRRRAPHTLFSISQRRSAQLRLPRKRARTQRGQTRHIRHRLPRLRQPRRLPWLPSMRRMLPCSCSSLAPTPFLLLFVPSVPVPAPIFPLRSLTPRARGH